MIAQRFVYENGRETLQVGPMPQSFDPDVLSIESTEVDADDGEVRETSIWINRDNARALADYILAWADGA